MTQNTSSDKITITQDDAEREIFMSFGLLNELATKIQSPEVLPAVSIDADLREEVLKTILAPRKKSGKLEAKIEDLGDVDVSVDDVERLLDWALEHTMNFFIRAVQRAEALAKRHEPTMKALVSSSDGSTT